MKPMGRKYFKNKTGGKHHVRIFGKFHAWWTDVCTPNKKAARQKAKFEAYMEASQEIAGDDYKAEIKSKIT